MTTQDFNYYVNQTLTQIGNLLSGKGKDYSQVEDDRFINFHRRADMLNKSEFEVIINDMSKHFDSLCQAIIANPTDPETITEPLEGRIDDIIGYSLLIKGMLKARRDRQKDTETVG